MQFFKQTINIKLLGSELKLVWLILLQIFAVLFYLVPLETYSIAYVINEYNVAWINFVIQLAVMVGISYGIKALMPKPKTSAPQEIKPAGLEQFNIPTAQEGRSVQVLFGKKYIKGPNVAWYGDLHTKGIYEYTEDPETIWDQWF